MTIEQHSAQPISVDNQPQLSNLFELLELIQAELKDLSTSATHAHNLLTHAKQLTINASIAIEEAKPKTPENRTK